MDQEMNMSALDGKCTIVIHHVCDECDSSMVVTFKEIGIELAQSIVEAWGDEHPKCGGKHKKE